MDFTWNKGKVILISSSITGRRSDSYAAAFKSGNQESDNEIPNSCQKGTQPRRSHGNSLIICGEFLIFWEG